MGKSPGKWIKAVLFGKKSSKSNFSKSITIQEKASVTAKTQTGDFAVHTPVISDQTTGTRDEYSQLEKGTSANLPHTQLEKGTSANFPCDVDVILPEIVDENVTIGSGPANDIELTKLEDAATKAQAAFRGYLARRAFRALKGIIRLQALVRGHLVRRQAVATLRCMQAVVKLQALVRGRKVRVSEFGSQVQSKGNLVHFVGVTTFLRSEKLSKNVFVTKLVASLPTAMPLSIHYDLAEPNSAWNWLERWSISRFWAPLPRQKKTLNAKPKRKQSTIQLEETESGKPKRGVWKAPTKHGDNNSESEKPKRNPRKVPVPQNEPDPPQIELEKIKRNLRKVSVSGMSTSEKSEAVAEKPLVTLKKVSTSPTHEKSTDKTDVVSNQPEVEPLPEDKPPLDVVSNDNPVVEIYPQESNVQVESGPAVKEEVNMKEEHVNKENLKTRRRRSLPVKPEYTESVPQTGPTVPSYMAATESAKAKLRAQESLRLAEEGAENGSIRRHSLPTSTNGKLSTPSPRMQKPVVNGKGGNKSGRLALSTKDGWKR